MPPHKQHGGAEAEQNSANRGKHRGYWRSLPGLLGLQSLINPLITYHSLYYFYL